MSGNAGEKQATQAHSGGSDAADPRVQRTRDSLGDALMELMQEKPFEEISVQEVLDRAGVGRTTFYTHYRDKQDLFLSDVEEFFEGMSALLTRKGADARRVAPVREFFAHVADVHEFHAALTASGKGADVRELGVGYFSRSIKKRLASAGVGLPATELRAASYVFAGMLFSMLEWWLRQGKTASPEEMDLLYHRLVWQGVDQGL